MFEPTQDSDERVSSPGSASGFSLVELVLAVRNNLWLVVGVALAATLAAAYYTSTRTRMYQASATVRFDPQAPRPLGDRVTNVADIQSDYWNRQEYYNTQFWQIRSKSTALPVVRQYSLHKNAGFVFGKPADQTSGEALVDEDGAAAILQGRLSVTGVEESRLATVSYADANPERAVRILNAILRAYTAETQAESRAVGDSASEWLGGQVASLKEQLEKSELELHEYKKDKQVLDVSADDQSAMLRAKMEQLTAELTSAEAERAKIGARRTEMRKVAGNDPDDLPTSELMRSDTLSRLREKFVQATAEYESLIGAGRGANHPEVAAVRSRVDSSRRLLLQEIKNIKESVERDYAAASSEVASLTALLDDARKKALDLNLLAIEYKRLERTRDTNEKLYSMVTERAKETDVTRMLSPSSVKIVDPPTMPFAPYSPNVPLNMMAGILGGIALGLILAIGREQLDSTLRTPEAVEQVFSLPFLGILPVVQSGVGAKARVRGLRRALGRRVKVGALAALTPDQRTELAVHNAPASSMAEAARAIRTNLLLGERSPSVLLVTSSAPGDGKTTVACSLAISFANAGQRVVLVDCDLRRPRLHRVFGVPNELGITSVVAGSLGLEDAMQKSMVPGLTLLTSGHLPTQPAEMLHGEKFALLIRELRERFDRVVIDSPPLIPVTDAAILAAQVDGTVVVSRAFETKKHTARRAARVLGDVGANVLGVVLNGVDFTRGEYRYYEYYDYSRERAPHSLIPPSRGAA